MSKSGAVISLPNVDNIYKIPLVLRDQGIGEFVNEKFGFKRPPANIKVWENVVGLASKQSREVTIAMVGKYVDLVDAYKSINEALRHAGLHTGTKVNIKYIDAEDLEKHGAKKTLRGIDGILVPGGFGKRGTEGMILAVEYARKNKVPYFGICLGMQIAVIEFARHEAKMRDANSTEFDQNTKYPVIALVEEWLDEAGKVEKRSSKSDLGGTMRLGNYSCHLVPKTLSRKTYNTDIIVERYRHRYEVNGKLLPVLEKAGLQVAGRSTDGNLVEIIELSGHPWFFGCQFHPEFNSNPRSGHPVFIGFIKAARVLRG
jgi:CTP synthase